jgi:hypothetical protein
VAVRVFTGWTERELCTAGGWSDGWPSDDEEE